MGGGGCGGGGGGVGGRGGANNKTKKHNKKPISHRPPRDTLFIFLPITPQRVIPPLCFFLLFMSSFSRIVGGIEG